MLSSQHHHQANGAAVKAIKSLIVKSTDRRNLNTDARPDAIIEFRNTPWHNGLSP